MAELPNKDEHSPDSRTARFQQDLLKSTAEVRCMNLTRYVLHNSRQEACTRQNQPLSDCKFLAKI